MTVEEEDQYGDGNVHEQPSSSNKDAAKENKKEVDTAAADAPKLIC